MKKILKSIFISILCVIAIFSNTILAFADDNTNIGLTANPFYLDIPISTYSTSLPTKTYNLSTKGRYYFSGKANVQNLYSNYLFTGVSKVKIHAKNYKKTAKLKIQLRQERKGINKTISTQYVEPKNYVTYTVTVSSSGKYYLKFFSESDFDGYIEKA